jgi:pentafunctional AROM polypeptide
MGCKVSQTDTTTTVTGTKKLKPIPHIDMESMTDAFMTATVLAAVATLPNNEDSNTTRITGIANQRVKECDRIAAMITELDRLGVKASELPDGLQIHGIDRTKLINTAPHGIKCYDDHRIAMSFSILCCAYPVNTPGPIILEKKCVEKTWPAWWDTLQNSLKMHQLGVDQHPLNEKVATSSVSNEFSIVLIGMRGAGKTHMGRSASIHLGWNFVDMDDYFEQQTSQSIPKFIETNSWEQFREKESLLLVKALAEYSVKTVIACGGGVVEAPTNREALKRWSGLVVHVRRDIAAIESYLNIDTTRPMYGEDMRSVWNRRQAFYEECSSEEFVIISPCKDNVEDHYKNIEKDFGRFLDFKLHGSNSIATDSLSFFLSLTCAHVEELLPCLDTISEGSDALELRVDLLDDFSSEFIGLQVALLRRNSTLPIVYTVRSEGQGGRFPNNDVDQMLRLIELGFKLGCEYVDIEFGAPMDRFQAILSKKGHSKIIGSYHDISGVATWSNNGSMAQKYKELYPVSDIIKLIGKAKTFSDNFALYSFTNDIAPKLCSFKKPLIALLMGKEGQLSRSLNAFFTPVTHPEVPVAAAPGQVSVKQIHETRSNIGLLDKKKYVLFGKPIQMSMSPTIHNTGFECLGLPYHYGINETDDVNQVKNVLQVVDGASVTIPLKVAVMDLCTVISESAKRIGAVNTLYKKNGEICGTNTDWIGIKNCVEPLLQTRPFVGVVLGAGGTSRAALYALQQMGAKEIRIWNRTNSKASQLAQEFGVSAVSSLEHILSGSHCFVVIGTVPSDAQEKMPLERLFVGKLGVVVDMAYRPRETRLLRYAKENHLKVIEGIHVLLEQGYQQFEIWTGRKAFKKMIEKQVMSKY